MSTTREKILKILLDNPAISINELAEAVGINGISVRHHLSSLQVDGLIIAREERHGVGRPRQIFSLSEKGMEQFPTSYIKFSNTFISQIKEIIPEKIIKECFLQIAAKIIDRNRSDWSTMAFTERLNMLITVLAEEGFHIKLENDAENIHLRLLSCPLYQVGATHPEICLLDQHVISGILEHHAARTHCILSGDAFCNYQITPKADEHA